MIETMQQTSQVSVFHFPHLLTSPWLKASLPYLCRKTDALFMLTPIFLSAFTNPMEAAVCYGMYA